jgi:hypothetical protein
MSTNDQTTDVLQRVQGKARMARLSSAAVTKAESATDQQKDPAEAIQRASELLAPSMQEREAPEYPAAALGALADVCAAIADHGQVQPAMVGQCLLGAASLLVQGLTNVETLEGKKPTSLNMLTLAGSGEGKSTAQRAALHPVQEWQRQEARQFTEELDAYEKAKANRKKGDDPPGRPRPPYRIVTDPTVEGIRRDMTEGVISQGVYNDEAAAIMSGHGMSPEHKAKTGAVLARMWDGGHLSVSRAGGPRIEKFGLRLAHHWMLQPELASQSISDPLLTQLGFWPRFILAWPSPQQPRVSRPFMPDQLPEVRAYWGRCSELLNMPLPEDADQNPALALEPGARQMLSQAFERFEVQARRGNLRSVKPFALRATEQACRLSGVLAAFRGAGAVSKEDMHGGLQLVAYSLTTWRAVLESGTTDDTGRSALALYRWLTTRPAWIESLPVVLQRGPSCVRSKDRRDAAIATLQSVGLAAVDEGKVWAMSRAGGVQ